MKRLILLLVVVMAMAFRSNAQTGGGIATAYITSNSIEGRAELVFEEPVSEQVTVVVKDLTGKTVYSVRRENKSDECTSIPLDFETLRKGMYIVQVIGSSGKVKTLKFQKV